MCVWSYIESGSKNTNKDIVFPDKYFTLARLAPDGVPDHAIQYLAGFLLRERREAPAAYAEECDGESLITTHEQSCTQEGVARYGNQRETTRHNRGKRAGAQ